MIIVRYYLVLPGDLSNKNPTSALPFLRHLGVIQGLVGPAVQDEGEGDQFDLFLDLQITFALGLLLSKRMDLRHVCDWPTHNGSGSDQQGLPQVTQLERRSGLCQKDGFSHIFQSLVFDCGRNSTSQLGLLGRNSSLRPMEILFLFCLDEV